MWIDKRIIFIKGGYIRGRGAVLTVQLTVALEQRAAKLVCSRHICTLLQCLTDITYLASL